MTHMLFVYIALAASYLASYNATAVSMLMIKLCVINR